MKKLTLAFIALVMIVAGSVYAFRIDQGCYTIGKCTYCHFIMFDDNGNTIDKSWWSIGSGCATQG